MEPASWLEINLSRLDANIAAVREIIAPDCKICGVVKADAYGLGAVPISLRMARNGIDLLAVYNFDQAVELLDAKVGVDVLMMMACGGFEPEGEIADAMRSGQLLLTAHSQSQLDELELMAKGIGGKLSVYIEVDTGMSRGGVVAEASGDLLRRLVESKYVKLKGLFTHPSCASYDEEFTDRQMEELDEFLAKHGDVLPGDTIISFANSDAMLISDRFHKSMVRVGISLLGYRSIPCGVGFGVGELKAGGPIMRWMSRIVHIKRVPAGRPVGYGSRYTTERESVFGIVPVGFYDGYPFADRSRGCVRVGDGDELAVVPIRGRVNMDQLIIDLTGVDGVGVGTLVEVVSADPTLPNSVQEIAKDVGMYSDGFMCHISLRVERRYIESAGW